MPAVPNLDVYFPRASERAQLEHALGNPAAAGVLVQTMAESGLTSFLEREFYPGLSGNKVFLDAAQFEASKLIASILAVGENGTKDLTLVVDSLESITVDYQAAVVEVLLQVARVDPDRRLRFVAGFTGVQTEPLRAVVVAYDDLGYEQLPPMGETYIRALSAMLAQEPGLDPAIFGPDPLARVFQAVGLRPGRLKAVIREAVRNGHPSLEAAQRAIDAELGTVRRLVAPAG